MKRTLFIILIIIFTACKNTVSTPSINGLTSHDNLLTKRYLNVIFEKMNIFPDQTQASFAFIKNGANFFYGIKKEGNILSAIENYDKVFEIGSITKVFTSALLAELACENKISLNDTINKYYDIDFKNNHEITFQSLANHTSGLPKLPFNFYSTAILHPNNPYKDYTVEKLLHYLQNDLSLSFEEKIEYRYSNLGPGLLAYTLTKSEKNDYQNLLEKYIFTKYKMHNSTTLKEFAGEKMIQGLDADGNPAANWDFSALAGAGAILSSTEDLSKFAAAQFDSDNKAAELARTQTYSLNENSGIALAWHIKKNDSGSTLYWHNGGTGGYSSCMIFDVENKNCVIILTNVSALNKNSDRVDKLCFELMQMFE